MKKKFAALKFFNIFDLTVLILLTVIILGTTYYFAVANFGVSGNLGNSIISLSIEMLDDTFADKISVGDKIYDCITETEIGTVEAIENFDCMMPIPDSNGEGENYSQYPGYHNVRLQIRINGYTMNTKDGSTVIISGTSGYKNQGSALFRTEKLQFTAKISIYAREKKNQG